MKNALVATAAATVLVMCLASSGTIQAQSLPQFGTTYDYQTGNSYRWSTRPYSGETQIDGYNLRTGRSWSNTIEPNGDQRGWDSRGNYWTYDRSSDTYTNYGTGRFCSRGYCN